MGLKSQWSKLDYFLPMSLVKEENALKDIKGGNVAINNGASKVFEGFEFFNSASPITINFKNINNIITDSLLGGFLFSYINDNAQPRILFNGSTNGLMFNVTSNRIETWHFNTTINSGRKIWAGSFIAKNSYYAVTEDGQGSFVFNDQKSLLSDVNTETYISNNTIGHNLRGKVSFIDVGASKGINQIAKNDIYRTFLEDLGINLTPEPNKLAGATITDTLQGATVADELIGT